VYSYDISVLGWPVGHPKYEAARKLLAEKNKNDDENSPDGLIGMIILSI
jgi:manganese-dependent ADP-ribose/CDP-alcohol diphosphatase